jgi:hypothetical protein
MHNVDAIQHGVPHGPDTSPYRIPVTAQIIIAFSGLKVLGLVLLATPLVPGHQSEVPALIGALAWAGCAAVLLAAHDRSVRTANIGIVVLLVASVFAAPAVRRAVEHVPPLLPLTDICFDTFIPWFLGRFLLEFPQPRTGRAARWLGIATRIALVYGAILFVVTLFRTVGADIPKPWPPALFERNVDNRVYWGPFLTFCMALVAAGFIGHRGWLADDRRRGRRLLIATILCLAPYAIQSVGTLVAEWRHTGSPNALRGLPLALLTFSNYFMPLLIVRAVLTGRHVRVRLVLRRLLRSTLASPFLLSLAAVPPVVVAIRMWILRDGPVTDALPPTAVAWLLVAAAAGMARHWQRPLLRATDARFFRDHYDPADALAEISPRLRLAASLDEFVAVLTSGIDRVLRPWRVTVLVRNESGSHFVSMFAAADPLPAASVLAELASQHRVPLDTSVAGPKSPLRWLPLAERLWLVDSSAHVLVPLSATDRTLLGVVAISERRSRRPLDDGDRRWLADLADVAARTLETRTAVRDDDTANHWHIGPIDQHARARECPDCGAVSGADQRLCPECDSPLDASDLPLVLFGKFQFQRRVGRGGQGVVYRARDLSLDRPVAIKALPGTSPEHAERLRHEARVMAAVTHRHLAVVYGMESWRGQPLLLCEFMEQGTLADRLDRAPLPANDALMLGIMLADALGVLHARNLLHRDIKPSNIGYDAAGVPKLLDFGLVHLLSHDTAAIPFAGTPLYMSPEALAGAAPSHAFDVWSLHVLLYEAIAGRHPFRRKTAEGTMRAVAKDTPLPLTVAGGLSPERTARLAQYFSNALSKDPARRPRSTAEAATALRELMD